MTDSEPAPVSPIDLSTEVARTFVDRARNFLLNEYRPKIELCLNELTDEQIWWRPNEQTNSIGNLVLHLCGNSRQWIVSGVGNTRDDRTREAEFACREIITRSALLALLQTTLFEVDEVLQNLDARTVLEERLIQGRNVTILHAIFHVTEHFSMHTGQIIMLTKIATNKDLRFYDVSTGVPVDRWHI